MKFKSNQEGKCPICNSENLEYFGMELMDNAVYYPWHCSDCDTEGKEWYYANFSEVRDIDDNVCETEGMCPNCGCEGDIEYGIAEPDGMSLKYEFHCPECENSGYEWYDLDFDSHTIDGHEDEKIELVKESRSATDIEKEIQTKVAQYRRLQKANNGDTAKSKDIEDEIEDLEAQLKKLKKEAINYKDDKITVTTAEDPKDDREYYGRNMTKRDKVRSLDQAKRNLDRMEKDPRVTQGQAIDQVSFDSALDTDLARYKHNKDMAKIDKAQGNDFWADEHNKTAKQFADKIRDKHKKQEDIDYKDDRYIATTAEDTNDERAYYGKNMTKRDKVRSLDQAKRNLNRIGKDPRVTQGQAVDQVSFDDKALDTDLSRYKTNKAWAKKSAEKGDKFWTDEHNKQAQVFSDKIKAKHKKQEDIEDEEEPDINLDDTISLLDMALAEVPTIGVEDWGKDDELLFIADTKVLFENLKNYEHKIPKHYYDNAGNDDWSNGIDDYLQENYGINVDDGDSDNTYNWNAPLTHNVEFTIYEANGKCFFKGSIHRAGDVRGNYTTEFLLEFNDKDDCLEAIFDACSENCVNEVTLDGVTYIIVPHFFSDCVSIFDYKNQKSYDDVYCSCIDELKEIIAGNTDDEPTQY